MAETNGWSRAKARRGLWWLALLALLALLLAGRFYGWPLLARLFPTAETGQTPPENLSGPYPLLYVIDGDTLQLSIDGQSKRVRLIGVDAPESAQRDESKNTPEGEAAALFMKELLKGKNVQLYLEYDEQRIDTYGRTLAYVYMDDGETMLQEALLRAGMAEPLPIAPNDRYSERFEGLNADARRERAGLYGGR